MSAQLPLFELEKSRKLAGLEAERAELLCRMVPLQPMSHKRVIMQDRLTAVTTQILQIECELTRVGYP